MLIIDTKPSTGKPKLQFVCCRFERQDITGSAASKIRLLWGQGCSPIIGFKCYKLYTEIDFTVSSVERFSIYLFTLGINISKGNLIGSGTFFTVPEHLVARFQKAAGDREIKIPKQSQPAVASSGGSWQRSPIRLRQSRVGGCWLCWHH